MPVVRRDALITRLALLALLVLFASGCGPTRAGDLGAVFDATPDYPGYVWTRDGHAVTPEEFGTIAAPRHCDWQSATFLFTAWPPGTPTTSSDRIRQYVRDPKGVIARVFKDRLVLHATLPKDARPTGYAYQSIQVFTSPTDQDDAIYVVGPTAVERWPRSDPLTLCS
jgi:hypothetical protein